jgi:hypothetical protein
MVPSASLHPKQLDAKRQTLKQGFQHGSTALQSNLNAKKKKEK